jgi:branched-subunit amino acid ABC-type transport system permease component
LAIVRIQFCIQVIFFVGSLLAGLCGILFVPQVVTDHHVSVPVEFGGDTVAIIRSCGDCGDELE